jgi:hypothetical protein
MSYSNVNTCWNCTKKEKCTDHVHIQNAINEIHKGSLSKEEGHMGSGSIVHQCSLLDAKDK